MAIQVGSCCKSASAALRLGDLPAESPAGDLPTLSSSSSSSLAFSKSRRAFGVRRERGNCVVRTSVGNRGGGGGALVVRARSGEKKSREAESKAVYDAFFLGRALAETINERVSSAIGEFLSVVGRRQSEQQKRIREFQDEVQERAAAAAVKAAQKAMAIEKEKEKEKASTSPPPRSPSPTQPPPSTSGLSNPDDVPTSISIDD